MKAMLISVGGTPELVVASTLEHQPQYICFFASQQSMSLIGKIRCLIKEKRHETSDAEVICHDQYINVDHYPLS